MVLNQTVTSLFSNVYFNKFFNILLLCQLFWPIFIFGCPVQDWDETKASEMRARPLKSHLETGLGLKSSTTRAHGNSFIFPSRCGAKHVDSLAACSPPLATCSGSSASDLWQRCSSCSLGHALPTGAWGGATVNLADRSLAKTWAHWQPVTSQWASQQQWQMRTLHLQRQILSHLSAADLPGCFFNYWERPISGGKPSNRRNPAKTQRASATQQSDHRRTSQACCRACQHEGWMCAFVLSRCCLVVFRGLGTFLKAALFYHCFFLRGLWCQHKWRWMWIIFFAARSKSRVFTVGTAVGVGARLLK